VYQHHTSGLNGSINELTHSGHVYQEISSVDILYRNSEKGNSTFRELRGDRVVANGDNVRNIALR
jgi:hypothetical protein